MEGENLWKKVYRDTGAYAVFVARICKYQNDGNDIGEAADHAVDDCIREGVLEELLRSRREEVRWMLLTEHDGQQHTEKERRITVEEVCARGAEWGKEAGEESFGELTNLLLKALRIEDLQRAAEDREYRLKK